MTFEDTYRPRIEQFLTAAQERGAESVLFYSSGWRREDVRYVTGFNFTGPFNMVFATSDGKIRMGVSSSSDLAKARNELPWVDEVILEEPNMGRDVEAWEKAGFNGNIGVTGLDLIPISLLKKLEDSFPASTLVPMSDVMDQLRLVKSPEEIRLIRKAGALCDEAYKTFLSSVADDRNGYEIIADVERTVKLGGAEDNFQIIAIGGTEVVAMAPPTDSVPVKGDLVRTEVTPFVNGFCAQICRTCVKGRPSREQLRGYDIFLRAEEEAIKIIRPGVAFADVARMLNDVFRAEGLGEYVTLQYTRARGHNLGLWQSEPPLVNEEAKTIVKENMAFVVHPNTYMPNVGYLVLGDTVIVTKEGVEVVTKSDRALQSV